MERLFLLSLFLLLSKVFGGRQTEETKPGEYPYTVSLQLPDLGGHDCGGALITESWVLTTGYCADTSDSVDHDRFIVVAGDWNLNSDEGTEQVRHVEKVYHHPYFSAEQSCDLALIRLVEPMVLDEYVQTIDIAEMDQEFQGECVETGWSKLSGKSTLQLSRIGYIPTEECQAQEDFGSQINFSTFCGGEAGTGTAAMCPGYTGSPVVCGNGTLAGFQSYTWACQTPGSPSVYAKISALRDWVDYIMAKYED